MTHHEYRQNFNVNEIATSEEVIHPALDWINGQLIMGVVLNNEERAIMSSAGKIVTPKELGAVCKNGENFSSPITPKAAAVILANESPTITSETLISRISEHIRRFVVFPEPWMSDAVATWILASYVYPVFQAFPYLWITSPHPGCGKSVLGQTIARVAFNGEFLTAPNEAHLFRLAEQSRGVQVWDEVELKEEGERKRFANIKAILLSGYRNGGTVPRQAGKNWERVEKFHVFCPRVFIGLSQLPEAALQRTIRVKMARRETNNDAEIYDKTNHVPVERAIKDDCVIWALQNAPAVATLYNDPSGLRRDVEAAVGEVGRQADDIWLPLFSVSRANNTMDSKDSKVYAALSSGAASHREKTPEADFTVTHFQSARRQVASDVVSEEDREVLRVALGILDNGRMIPSSELAELVSNDVGVEVTTQKLSKRLTGLGIPPKKKSGLRMIQASARQLTLARRQMGISEEGQEGQQGQELDVEQIESMVNDPSS